MRVKEKNLSISTEKNRHFCLKQKQIREIIVEKFHQYESKNL